MIYENSMILVNKDIVELNFGLSQWRIQDFPEGRTPTSEGVLTYYLA